VCDWDSPDACDSLPCVALSELAEDALDGEEEEPLEASDPGAGVDALASGVASAAAPRLVSPPAWAVRKRSAPTGITSMPSRAALDSTTLPAASSEFSMLSAAFSRCSDASWRSA
jgi:hypothetical protein